MDTLYNVLEQVITDQPILFNGFDCQPALIGITSGVVVVVVVYSVCRIIGALFKK